MHPKETPPKQYVATQTNSNRKVTETESVWTSVQVKSIVKLFIIFDNIRDKIQSFKHIMKISISLSTGFYIYNILCEEQYNDSQVHSFGYVMC